MLALLPPNFILMPAPNIPKDTETATTAPIMTPAFISAIRRQPNLPRNVWPLIAATTLSVLNRPDEIPKVYTHAIQHGQGAVDAKPGDEEQLAISRRMREALVKSAAIGGLPKVSTRTSHPPSTPDKNVGGVACGLHPWMSNDQAGH